MLPRPAPLEDAGDREGYLEAFGVPATCEAGELLVIYDKPSEQAVFDDTQINTSSPQCQGPTRTFKKLRLHQAEARITIETEDDGPKDFIVREARADGTGWSTLILDHA